ncbi:MAG TPA: hypothetical protein ENK25_07835 [Bacteroidetes bacterium]|nr:hypothetical protein [Bacteroidota bacterium]
MNDRNTRLYLIRQMIRNHEIFTQEQLLEMLEERGYHVTQATLSRDLKFLRAGKIPFSNGRYKYVLDETARLDPEADYHPSSGQGFVSLEFAQQMALIRTLPGYANMLAISIDRARRYELAGTIAGDDTILIVPRDGVSREAVRKVLQLIFPDIAEKIARS